MVLFPLMQRQDYAVALAILNGFVAAWVLGPQNAALQIITPNRMRGQITALFLFAFNVVGFGLGPSFVAVLTDHVFGSEVRIGWSLATAAAILGPAGMAMIALSLKPYGARVAASRLIDA
jgi:sugar phosphate permease